MFRTDDHRVSTTGCARITATRWLLAGFIVFIGFGIDPGLAQPVAMHALIHEPPPGFVPGQSTAILFGFPAGHRITEARVYFLGGSDSQYLYVPARGTTNNRFSATIPALDPTTDRMRYAILWRSGNLVYRTAARTLHVLEIGNSGPPDRSPVTVYAETSSVPVNRLASTLVDRRNVEPVERLALRAALMEPVNQSGYRMGYFGAWELEEDGSDLFPVQGFVRFAPDATAADLYRGTGEPAQSDLSHAQDDTPMADGYPDVAGNDWVGVFYRTDSSERTEITASIAAYDDGNISVTTSLPDLGHFLYGSISQGTSGYVILTDVFDGETWTTHDLPLSSADFFACEDYTEKPGPGNRHPPLYRIELRRAEDIEPEAFPLAPIIDYILD